MIGFWDFTGHGNVGTSSGNFWLPETERVWVDGGEPAYIFYHEDEGLDEGLDTVKFYTDEAGHWETRMTGYLSFGGGFTGGLTQKQKPQKPLPGTQATAAIRKEVDALLTNKQCQKFLDSILSSLKVATGIAPIKNKFKDVFKDLSKRVGFYDGSGVIGDNYGLTELNNGSLSIGVDFSKATPSGIRAIGITAIHETLHAAASEGLYGQYDVAKAAYDVGRAMGLIPELVAKPKSGDSTAADKYNSDLLSSSIFAACGQK